MALESRTTKRCRYAADGRDRALSGRDRARRARDLRRPVGRAARRTWNRWRAAWVRPSRLAGARSRSSWTTCIASPRPMPMDVLRVLVDHMPRGSQLALASRIEPPLPVGRMRGSASPRHRAAGTRPCHDACRGRSAADAGSGCARATSTCSCSARRAGPPASISRRCRCRTSRIAIGRWPPSPATTGSWRTTCATSCSPTFRDDRLSFLTRTSALDYLSGPLCDAVLARPGSGGHAARARPIHSHAPSRWTERTAATATTACSRTCCRRSCA